MLGDGLAAVGNLRTEEDGLLWRGRYKMCSNIKGVLLVCHNGAVRVHLRVETERNRC